MTSLRYQSEPQIALMHIKHELLAVQTTTLFNALNTIPHQVLLANITQYDEEYFSN